MDSINDLYNFVEWIKKKKKKKKKKTLKANRFIATSVAW